MSWEIINPNGQPSGWNDGLLAPAGGRVLLVAGQTARDASGKVPDVGFAPQFRQVLLNILRVVEAAGARPADIGRLTVYVTDIQAYRAARIALAGIWKELMGTHYPAMTLVEVSALLDEHALLEVEATAVLPPAGGRTG